ncbi:hypothetical protein FO519_002806 [Halicephalobus sp. NKZ332]|nr:hypothetical protein FO519_002806 [Halicephalobus sp. NKZ332]
MAEEGSLHPNSEKPQWHNGFCVCRTDEKSLICYPNENIANNLGKDLRIIRLDDGCCTLPPVKSLPYLSRDYCTPISAYGELPSGTQMKTKKKRILPGFSATLDRVGRHKSKASNPAPKGFSSNNYSNHSNTLDYGNSKNYRKHSNYSTRVNYGSSKDHSNYHEYDNYSSESYTSRSATVSRFYGAGITRSYYSGQNPGLEGISFTSAWDLAAEAAKRRRQRLPRTPASRRFSRSCDQLDSLDENETQNYCISRQPSKIELCQNYSYSNFEKIPQNPDYYFRRDFRRPQRIIRPSILASPMVFRQNRNLRSKSNAVALKINNHRPLQYSVTIAPQVTAIPIRFEDEFVNQNPKGHDNEHPWVLSEGFLGI